MGYESLIVVPIIILVQIAFVKSMGKFFAKFSAFFVFFMIIICYLFFFPGLFRIVKRKPYIIWDGGTRFIKFKDSFNKDIDKFLEEKGVKFI